MRLPGPLLCGLAALGLIPGLLPAAGPRAVSKSAGKTEAEVQEHKVRPGETLWSISKRYRTSVGEIMDFNKLPNDKLRDGMMLKIPPRLSDDPRRVRQHVHVVEEEETFSGIAEEYGITVEALAKANPSVDRSRLKADTELVIPPRGASDPPLPKKTASPVILPAPPAPTPAKTTPAVAPPPSAPAGGTLHTIVEGDTFYGLSRRYGVSPEAIQAANPKVDSRRMKNGIQVVIPVKAPAAVAAASKRSTPPPPAPTPPAPPVTVKAPSSAPVLPPAPAPAGPVTLKPASSAAVILKPSGPAPQDAPSKAPPAPPKTVSTDHPPAGTGPALVPAPPAPPSPPPGPPPAPAPSPLTGAPDQPAPKSPPNTVGKDGVIRSYIVSAGETEDTICEAFGITKDHLYEYNRLPASTRLKPGDEIMIPRVANVPGE